MTDHPAQGIGGGEQPRQEEPETRIGAVETTAKLPQFWEEDPALWFIQAEAVFAAHRIISQKHRFNLVISQLPYKNLAQVADLAKLPGDNPYTTVKERLINAYSQSQEKRVLRLLEETKLGDNRPSQLLRHMQTVSDGSLSEQVLKTVWLRTLPARTKNILTALEQPLDQLALIADKILDIDPNDISSVNSKEDELTKLIAEVRQLKKIIGERSTRSRSRNRSSTRRTSPDDKDNKKYCYYHFKFREKAHKCKKPCQWSAESKNLN